MTLKYRTKGIIFKDQERSEADKIFSVFTKDYGRIEVLGKAIRKINSKLKSGVDLFYLSEIEFIQGKNNKTLTDASVIKRFSNIFLDKNDIELAHNIFNTLEEFIKGQERDDKVFELISETFDRLNDKDKKIINKKFIYYYFLWNFLSVQGFHLELNRCALCSGGLKEESVYFSNKNGGALCGECQKKGNESKKINGDVLKILRLFLDKKWEVVQRLKVVQESQNLLEKVSQNFVRDFSPSSF